MLVELLERDAVPLDTLHTRYGSVLQLVRKLLGVVPNCDPYLEIWPPAFRTYNVMVPNLLNLPFLVWGLGAPRSTVGLAMYVSSRTAGCAYCSAHACSFALRRGASVEQVTSALGAERTLSPTDRAAVRIAVGLAAVPASIDDDDRAELHRNFSKKDAEWIVLSIAMMGFLNKAMDALGVPLEAPVASEVTGVISPTGWTPGQHMTSTVLAGDPPGADSLLSRLSVVRYAPQAVKLDKMWTKGVPDHWPEVGHFLKEATGHSFPVLSQLRHRRAIRAIATMIKENFIEGSVKRDEKLAAGLTYARTVGNRSMEEELSTLGAKDLSDSPLQTLARAISPSPAMVDDTVVESSRSISAAAIVELVTFIAVLQMLQRLSSFYPTST